MTLEEFADRLAEASQGANDADITAFRRDISGTFSKIEMSEPPTRKNAARLLRLYLLNVVHEPDEDWGKYKDLKDIYDCRICANAIAQVCIKGLMKPVKRNEFGVNLPLTDEEAEETLKTIYNKTA